MREHWVVRWEGNGFLSGEPLYFLLPVPVELAELLDTLFGADLAGAERGGWWGAWDEERGELLDDHEHLLCCTRSPKGEN